MKVFFGSLKASKVSLILLIFYSLSMLPAVIGLLLSSISFIKETTDLMLYTNTLSALLSGLLALALMSTYRGTTAFEYEQSFVFTSSVTPRQFLIAGILADRTFSLLFLYPLPLILAIIVFSLGLSAIASFSILASFLLFFGFTLFLKSAFSIFGAIHKNMKMLATILIAVLLLPVINIFVPMLMNYESLPYPTTFMAQIILNSLSNKTVPILPLSGFLMYFLVSLAFFYFSSKLNFFQFASSTPLISAFDVSMSMQTRKADMNIKFFSKVGLKIALTPESKSLLTFLMKKEFIRILRDGSLFAILLLYTIVSITLVMGRANNMPVPIWFFLLALYSLIVPFILVSNWRMVETKSLWIPLTSGMNLKYVAESTLYVFTGIASTVPTVIIIALTFINQIDMLPPLVLVVSVSMIGCSVNLYTAVRFLGGGNRSTPSIITTWISMLMTSILLSPVYAFVVFNLVWYFTLELKVGLSIISFVYSTLVFMFFSKSTVRRALSMEQ